MPMLMTFLMRFAGVAFPFAAAHAVGESGHLVQHRVYFADNVLAVDLDLRRLGGAQGDVQHRAAFGDVDLLAAEHGVAPALHAALPGQLEQQPEGFVGDAVLGVVEVKPGAFGSQSRRRGWVIGKQLP